MDSVRVYEDATIARVCAPNSRNAERDAAARERRQIRSDELKHRREQTSREESKLTGSIAGEKAKLQEVTEKYESILRDPDKTNEAFHFRVQIDVYRERIARLEADADKLRQDLSGIGAELVQIAATEKQASEDEEVSNTLAKSGAEAIAIIEGFATGLQRLREITVRLHYESPTTCSPANGEKFRQLADDITSAFRISVFKRTFYQDLRADSQFLRMMRAEKWPSF
jgi:chromosome segregation ATPase